jgi:Lon protease-like protein
VPHQLPARPHLDHLKAQAKDLLDAYRRGERQAFDRIRASVPAFASMSDDALAKAAFALHDAQSAIAREYGFVSWAELRDKIAALTGAPPSIAADNEQLARLVASGQLSAEMAEALREATSRRGAGAGVPTPAAVPVLPLRNAVMFPGAVIPIDVLRPTTTHALDTALKSQPPFLAIFAQRATDIELPTQADLHENGCLCVVLHYQRAGAGEKSHAIVEGVRWVTLDALEQTDPYYRARVSDAAGPARGDDEAIAALDHRLRDTAHKVADAMPHIRDRAYQLIDQTKEVGRLADIVMASFGLPVADAAAYAAETDLARRLERAIAVLDAALAQAAAGATGAPA